MKDAESEGGKKSELSTLFLLRTERPGNAQIPRLGIRKRREVLEELERKARIWRPGIKRKGFGVRKRISI